MVGNADCSWLVQWVQHISKVFIHFTGDTFPHLNTYPEVMVFGGGYDWSRQATPTGHVILPDIDYHLASIKSHVFFFIVIDYLWSPNRNFEITSKRACIWTCCLNYSACAERTVELTLAKAICDSGAPVCLFSLWTSLSCCCRYGHLFSLAPHRRAVRPVGCWRPCKFYPGWRCSTL